MTTPTELQLAEQALDRAREELAHVEHCAPDDAALDRYVAAVIARNEARAWAGA